MTPYKQLLLDSRQFAVESRGRSWWCLGSTLLLAAALTAVTLGLAGPSWAVRLPASLLLGLTLVRLFVIFHDFQHGAILRNSWLARVLMTGIGLMTLCPPSIWRRSHDHHHKNNAKVFGASIGSYSVMTTDTWDHAGRGARLLYRIERHPLTMLAGYLTVFFFGMTLRSLWHNPRMHWDSALALLVHGSLLAAAVTAGWEVLLLAVVIPASLSSALGAYLFYAQHNYPTVKLRERSDWDHAFAALHSSSYIPMGRCLAYFTGNIGYHHIHHLNHRIPFYRLPEAMAALPLLQTPGRTTLGLRDIWSCMKLQLWDERRDQMISLREHRRQQTTSVLPLPLVLQPASMASSTL